MTVRWKRIDGSSPPPKEPLDADGVYGPQFLVWEYGSTEFAIASYNDIDDTFETQTFREDLTSYTHWTELPIPTMETIEK